MSTGRVTSKYDRAPVMTLPTRSDLVDPRLVSQQGPTGDDRVVTSMITKRFGADSELLAMLGLEGVTL